MGGTQIRSVLLLVLLSLAGYVYPADGVFREEAKQLRDEAREMFYHAFNGYMDNAFPLDELRPLSCAGEDTLGGYALTLIDSLDTLALLGDRQRFATSVEWLGKNLRFDINKTVSVFETTIRVLGGLLSAHLIASDYATGMRVPSYDNQLLNLAEDLARRLLPAFDTPTGIPFGSVNLLHGVDKHESKFLNKSPKMQCVDFGHGVQSLIWLVLILMFLQDAGIGTSIDSFYEYLLKAYLLFGHEEYLYIFQEAYAAAMHYLYHDPWYVEVNMDSAAIVWPLFNSLQAFWPGLQVLAGDINPAIRTHAAFLSVWRRYGFTPEGFNLASLSVQHGQKSYPLRPELIESTYWLYKATRDPRYLDAGRDMIASLQYGTRCPCGYCHISDVEHHKQEDHMESFFLAETVKYLWLLFDLAVGPDNLVENGPYKYVFSTEGHLLPATPQISLAREHCLYYGAYCRSGDLRQTYFVPESEKDKKESNDTKFYDSWTKDTHSSDYTTFEPSAVSGSIKGFCPGLNHGQKFGLLYAHLTDERHDYETNQVQQKESTTVQSHSVLVLRSQSSDHLVPEYGSDDSQTHESDGTP
ncbi:alpha-mannosidase I MNS4 isoform X2 [Vigna umbellata]|uniref:alpha-mannosidase I MNS4 isoform X2 n=1 Tax=Vigna umbellata TaxID=87088 RepID=UPI001F5FE12D|nr:alpha-mannosidase I MNS4 isoform X2 [Vigna umbellata]